VIDQNPFAVRRDLIYIRIGRRKCEQLVRSRRFYTSVLGAETGLLDAIRNDDTAAIKRLIHSSANLNSRNEVGATPLMYAAGFASADCMRLLLDAGAEVNATSNAGATALMWATGDTAKVRLLVEHGAQINAKAKDGITALVTAAFRGNVDAMRLLIEHGADARASAGDLWRAASRRENPDMRRLLTEAGLELKGANLLTDALMFPRVASPKFIQQLLDAGADPNEARPHVTVKFPVLSLAVYRGSAEAVEVLIDRGADPNRPDTRKRTPLMVAAAGDNSKLVRFLVDKGANINARDDMGRTPLLLGADSWSHGGRSIIARSWREDTCASGSPSSARRTAPNGAICSGSGATTTATSQCCFQ